MWVLRRVFVNIEIKDQWIVNDHLISKIDQEQDVQLNEVSETPSQLHNQSTSPPGSTWVLREKRRDVQNLAFNHNLKGFADAEDATSPPTFEVKKPQQEKSSFFSGKKKASLVS